MAKGGEAIKRGNISSLLLGSSQFSWGEAHKQIITPENGNSHSRELCWTSQELSWEGGKGVPRGIMRCATSRCLEGEGWWVCDRQGGWNSGAGMGQVGCTQNRESLYAPREEFGFASAGNREQWAILQQET